MKTTNKLFLAMMIFAATAQAGDPPPPSATAVGAEVNVTRDRIQQVIDQMMARGSNIGFSVSDYRAWAPTFKDKIRKALSKYEDTVQREIIPVATLWANRYNDIDQSPSYSNEQKLILRKTTDDQAIANFELLSKLNAKAIEAVYIEIFGDLTVHAKILKDEVRLRTKGKKGTQRTYSHNLTTQYSYGSRIMIENIEIISTDPEVLTDFYAVGGITDGLGYYLQSGQVWRNGQQLTSGGYVVNFWVNNSEIYGLGTDYKTIYKYSNGNWFHTGLTTVKNTLEIPNARVYEKLIFPQLTEICKSSLCLGLVAGDINFARSLIKATIDQPIAIIKNEFRKAINAKQLDISLIISLFNNTNYPQNNFPYDTP